MKITPIEIRQKEFEKSFRGYDKEAVDAFLISLSHEWERVMDENTDLRKRIEVSEKEVGRLREVENSLFRTLKSAEDAGNNLISSANKTAELHVREAQINAEAILNDAKTRSRNLLEESEEKAKEIIMNLQDEVRSLERHYDVIMDQKDSMMHDIGALMTDFSEKIKKYAGKADSRTAELKFKNAKKISLERSTDLPQYNQNIQNPSSERHDTFDQAKEVDTSETEGSFFDKI